eukprot:TRINITY_DN834_c0_g4_i1.p1 TRINITY_DN834_c0_g4~~TRINITY_DN834_c0_g4_i1.p1  ORF type:complete len:1008 (-),score=127.44 TRINITY_DN834_c0_g4_i1:889-3912(-)
MSREQNRASPERTLLTATQLPSIHPLCISTKKEASILATRGLSSAVKGLATLFTADMRSRMQASTCNNKNVYYAFVAVTLTVLLCTMATVSTALDTSSYAGMEQLDPGFLLYWQLNQPDSSIRFAIKAKTAGYVALGISEVGAMVGSDIMIGTLEEGMAVVIDAFAYNKTQVNGLGSGVVPDSQQDIKTIAGEEYTDENGDTWTVIEFTRKLNSSDCNDRPIAEGTNQIIWAMGSTDLGTYHGSRRGGTQLAFYGVVPNTVIPQGHEVHNLTAPVYNVPANYTTYACNTFNLTFPEKRHISSYSVILDTNAPESVHHVLVHACSEEEIPNVLNRKPNTEDGNLGCSRTLFLWAVGGKPVVLPDFAGLPVGRGTGATVVVMQVHYTNPEGRTDIVDRSGISFTIAPELRPIDAGVFATGPYFIEPQIRIPPKTASWKLESTCSSGCTTQGIRGNITIIGTTLHQHLLGKQLWTKLYRNSQEITTIGRADYYDFEFQTMVRPPRPVVVFPGDVLKTTCIWDSSNRNDVTLGGESTQNEMCMNYMLYYPLQENLVGGCHNGCLNPKADDLMNAFQPPFEGYGKEIQFCNDSTSIQTNNSCLYGPTGGQNEVVPPLFGCPASSLALVSAATRSQLQVPAKMSTTSTTPSKSCTSPFKGNDVPFQNCKTLGGGFSLKWNVSSPSNVTVAFSHPHNGWLAFGLSTSGEMVGSSAIVGFPSADGVTMDNYFLGGKSTQDVKPPGKQAASSLQGEFVNGELRMLFTLNLTPEQMKSTKVIWAKGSHDTASGMTLSKHSDAYSGSVSFQTGATTTAKRSTLRNVHGIINALAWGILIPVGAMLARYAKAYDPAWFYAHVTVQTLGFLLGVAGFSSGIVLRNRSTTDHSTHLALAALILALSLLQVLVSVLRPKKDSKNRWVWNACHHWTGRVVIVLAIVNIYVGLQILKPGSKWILSYSLILGVMVASAVTLEALKVLRARNTDVIRRSTSARVNEEAYAPPSAGEGKGDMEKIPL